MNHKIIVIDTNVLLSAALSPNGTSRKALDKVYKEFTIAQSDETYQELNTRIYKRKFDKYISDKDRQDFLEIVKKYSQFIEVKSQINTCRDPDDNKFLAQIPQVRS
ncbi:putative toxin-antitoxin system toxin component, PIN family [Nostoc sp. ATCC 53789]|uniref:putative toxin-antitoxin system toxin component, PIN family n=1 Tax=Nostoc sp. ATCC 53789 TaxID=76335 RepID=UPI000DED0D4A|nr:putative toxin-antitoxin system toxin component, PIN family [Nostoc sp. ATCC 53789]QHG18226.1 putative toxin-antitoxin system toxin component, PIN family [Nostoc sp. ATCC 53789]